MSTQDELLVAEVLKEAGFSVDRLSENDQEERADFRVSNESDGYIVEVKTKEDNPEEIQKFVEALATARRQ